MLDELARLDLAKAARTRGTPLDTLPAVAFGRRSVCITVHAADESEATSPAGPRGSQQVQLFASRLGAYVSQPGDARAARSKRRRVRGEDVMHAAEQPHIVGSVTP
jgi:hypothetical protein